MESQLPGGSEAKDPEDEGAVDEAKAEKKEGDDSSSGEYTYGSDDDDDDDEDSDEEESPKGKQIEEKGEKAGAKFPQLKGPPSDAELLARVQ